MEEAGKHRLSGADRVSIVREGRNIASETTRPPKGRRWGCFWRTVGWYGQKIGITAARRLGSNFLFIPMALDRRSGSPTRLYPYQREIADANIFPRQRTSRERLTGRPSFQIQHSAIVRFAPEPGNRRSATCTGPTDE